MATVTCSAPAYRLATTSNLLIRLFSKGASAPFQLVNKVRFVYVGCSVSALFRLQVLLIQYITLIVGSCQATWRLYQCISQN